MTLRKPTTTRAKVKPGLDLDSRLLAAVQRAPGKPLDSYHRALYLPPLRVGHLTGLRLAAERLVDRKLITVDDTLDGPVLNPTPKKPGG